jgi:excisionase family DNA binding protein
VSDEPKPYLTIAEAAQRIGINERTYRRRVEEGVLPAARFGGRLIVPAALLDEIVEQRARESLRDPDAPRRSKD